MLAAALLSEAQHRVLLVRSCRWKPEECGTTGDGGLLVVAVEWKADQNTGIAEVLPRGSSFSLGARHGTSDTALEWRGTICFLCSVYTAQLFCVELQVVCSGDHAMTWLWQDREGEGRITSARPVEVFRHLQKVKEEPKAKGFFTG